MSTSTDPVQKALWYVESHSKANFTLQDVAAACDVSAFHLTRGFTASMGLPLMRYVRARRLSDAARRLVEESGTILTVALDAGYSSHEAFTRAFLYQFELTPEQLRAKGTLDNLQLTDPITMNSTPLPQLAPPRFETSKPMLLAGLSHLYECQAAGGIPDQWQRLHPYLGHIPAQVGKVAYGVVYNFDIDGGFNYLCGVEIARPVDLPAALQMLPIPAHQYAVFSTKEHIATIRAMCSAIWNTWFPQSNCKPANAPTLERYGPEFNPQTGQGGFEIWIAIDK